MVVQVVVNVNVEPEAEPSDVAHAMVVVPSGIAASTSAATYTAKAAPQPPVVHSEDGAAAAATTLLPVGGVSSSTTTNGAREGEAESVAVVMLGVARALVVSTLNLVASASNSEFAQWLGRSFLEGFIALCTTIGRYVLRAAELAFYWLLAFLAESLPMLITLAPVYFKAVTITCIARPELVAAALAVCACHRHSSLLPVVRCSLWCAAPCGALLPAGTEGAEGAVLLTATAAS